MARNMADPYSRMQLRETAALWRQMAQSVETLDEIERKRSVTAEPSVGTMVSRARPADPLMTVGKMHELGVHELNVVCLNPACRHEITFGTDCYADDINLSWFRPRMICAKCGDRRLDVLPNWKERLHQ
jgi:hypothetical protein